MLKSKGSGWIKKFDKWLKGNEGSDGEWKAYCPLHENPKKSKTPSASFNFSKGAFMCFGGCGGMSVSNLWRLMSDDRDLSSPHDQANVRSISSSKKARQVRDLPTDKDLQAWQDTLLNSPTALATLTEERGLDLKTIKWAGLGFNAIQGRYMIPVYDKDGNLLNVRMYKHGASQPQDKMRNIAGHGSQTLYLPDALEYDTIILTEGEMDALIARRYGFISMTHTSGAGSWNARWSSLFEGKTVYIIYDNDDGGRSGALRTSQSVRKFADNCYIIRLPLSGKGEDLTDYFVKQGHTAEDLQGVLDSRKETLASRNKRERMTKEPLKVTLEQSMHPDFVNVPITYTATIAGKVQPAYALPKKTGLSCTKDWGDKCKHCPMVEQDGEWERDTSDRDSFLLKLIDKPVELVNKAILKEANIPVTCPNIELTREQSWSVEELIVIPSVDDRGEEAQAPIQRRVYNVGQYATPLNIKAEFVGFNTSDPRSGRGILQTWESIPTLTNLDKFQMTPEIREALSIFRPKKKQAPMEKMEDIAKDLEFNVTRIYGRPGLHIAYDAVWHSVMDFRFNGIQLGKGWLEMLVMGDTRTGKSEVATRMCEHYQSGVLKSCEGATFAGLVGGAQKVGDNNWIITWGTIPLQDRRLIILDEVSGMGDKNIIEQMSSIRSSGLAQMTKIASQQTSARVRTIWISNPSDGRTIADMNRGAIDAVEKLISNPEDIARFDLAMCAASGDVDSKVINTTEREEIPHRYTSDLCSLLVSWVWSRRADDVWWEDGVENYVVEQSQVFGEQYTSEPPLVQVESVRIKIARLAVAIAARLFSTDKSGEKVLVSKAHVDAAIEMLHRLYGMPNFGYLENSTKEIKARAASERNRKNCRRYLINNESVLSSLKFVINDTHFRTRDFEEFGGMSRDEAQIAVIDLMRLKMIRRQSKGYVKMQPELISVVKQLEKEEDES